MPETVDKVKQKPSRSYNFDLWIKDLNYTSDLRRIQIVSTIASAYPIITIDLSLDPKDIILERIYGKEPLKLSAKLIGRGMPNVPVESIDFELMYIQGIDTLPQKSSMSNPDEIKQRVTISFMTVCRQPYKTMTTLANEIIEQMTPKEAIQYIVENYTEAELIYDSDDQNKTIIEQMLLPPTTIYNIIDYIDSNFGLFNGSSNMGGYCQYDNKIYVMNLSKRITKSQTFTIYHLSTDSKDTEKIIDQSVNGKIFYTYGKISSDFSGNTKIAGAGQKITHILKPLDKLFYNVEKDYVSDVAQKYGAVDKNPKVDVDPEASRKVYKIMQTGVGDTSDTFINARLSRDIVGLATIGLELEKDLPILELMKVGEPVKLNSKTVDYTDLSGKYILKSSNLVFERNNNDWSSTANLVLMRTNKTI